MISKKVIVKNVNNLTDARYYAAWGVEWIVFDFSLVFTEGIINPNILEIMDWIEGCNYAIEIENTSIVNDKNLLIIQDKFDGIVTNNNNLNIEGVENIGYNDTISCEMVIIDDITQIKNNSKQYYLDSEWTSTELKEYLSQYPTLGYVVQGGDEDKVGYKSFENIDGFFELIDEE